MSKMPTSAANSEPGRHFVREVRTPLADFRLMRSDRGDAIVRRNCPDGQFWMVTSGRWRFKEDGNVRRLGPMDLAYSAPQEPCLRTSEEQVVAFGVQVRLEALTPWPESRAWLGPEPAITWEVRRSLLMLMKAVTIGSSPDDLDDQLLRMLHRSPSSRPPERAPSWVFRAREVIEEDAPENQGLSSIATAVGISPAHLSNSFRTTFGVSLSAYRRRVRLDRALALVGRGAPMNRAAIEAGFYDGSHFHRICLSELGLEPGRLKIMLMAEESKACTSPPAS